MTVHQIKGSIVFECDGCGDNLDTSTLDFIEARTTIKEAEWNSRRDDAANAWQHFCPRCKS